MSAQAVTLLRKQLSMTQRQLAERLGITRETVARWEIGSVKPPPYAIELLERLGLDAKWSRRTDGQFLDPICHS